MVTAAGAMPTAARRAKQREARERAIAAASSTAAEAPKATGVKTANKSTQTTLDELVICGLLRKYWTMLEKNKKDIADQPVQFIINEIKPPARCSTLATRVHQQSDHAHQTDSEDYEDYDIDDIYEEYGFDEEEYIPSGEPAPQAVCSGRRQSDATCPSGDLDALD